MKIGVQLPEVEREVRWAEVVRMAVLAEEVGLDSIWVGDHLLYDLPGVGPRGPWEAWTSLAALAEATSRVELGPLVAATAFHQPPMLAKMASTVDEISEGRLILGLGAGWNEREFRAFGFPYDRRVSRFEEAFTIIRRLLREGRVDLRGEFYTAEDCVLSPRSPRPAGPPLIIGSSGHRMLTITLPYVDGWNVWWARCGNSPDGFAAGSRYVDEVCVEVGRDPAEIERTVAVLCQFEGGGGRIMGGDVPEGIEPVHGPPERMAESLAAFGAAGADHLQLVLDPITEDTVAALAPVLAILGR